MSKELHRLPKTIDFSISRVRPMLDGSSGDPAIGFDSHPTTGWYLNRAGEVVLTIESNDNILQNSEFTEFKKPILLNEREPGKVTDGRGYLYKKPGSDGLWWKTINGEVNLIDIVSIKKYVEESELKKEEIKNGENMITRNPIILNDGELAPIDIEVSDLPDSSIEVVVDKVNEVVQLDLGNSGTSGGLSSANPVLIDPLAGMYAVDDILNLSKIDAKIEDVSNIKLFGGSLFADGNRLIWRSLSGQEIDLTEKDVFGKDVPGKADLAGVREDIARIEADITTKIDTKIANVDTELTTKLDTKIANVEADVNDKLTRVEAELTTKLYTKIANVEADVNDKLTRVEAELTTKLDTKIANVEAELTTKLDTKIANAEAEIATLQNKIESSLSNVDSKIATTVTNLPNVNTGIDEKINSVENDLTTKIDTLQNKLESVDDKIARVDDKITKAEFYLASVSTEVTAKIDTLQNKLESVDDKISRVDDKISRVDDKITKAEFDLASKLENGLAVVGRIESDVNSKIDTLQNKLESVDDKLSSVDDKISRVESDLASAGTDINSKLDTALAVNKQEIQSIMEQIRLMNLSRSVTPVLPDKIMAVAHTTPGVSDFSWANDTDTGLALLDDNVFAGMAGGNIKIAIAEDQVILYDKLAIKDSESAGPSLSTEGHLYKKAGSPGLFWKTTNCDVDLSQVTWPLSALPSNKSDPSYSFVNAPQTGMYGNGTTVGVSIAGESVLELTRDTVQINKPLSFSHGQLYPSGKSLIWDVNGSKTDLSEHITQYPLLAPDGTIFAPSYSFESDSTSGFIKDLDSIAVVIANGPSLYIKKHEVNVIGDITVSGEMTLAGGILRRDGDDLVWMVDGKQTVISRLVDVDTVNTATAKEVDVVPVKEAEIKIVSPVPVKPVSPVPYNGSLEFVAGSTINRGDVICMDPSGNGKVHNGIGGLIYALTGIDSYSGPAKTISVFPIDEHKFLVVTTSVGVDNKYCYASTKWYLIDKTTMAILKTNVNTVNEFPILSKSTITSPPNNYYCKVLQLSVDRYAIISSMSDSSVIKAVIVDSLGLVKESTIFEVKTSDDEKTHVTSMTAEYDVHTNMIVIASYVGNSQNFAVVLLGFNELGNLQVGTIQVGISTISMVDDNKQIHLVLIPGGACVLSYGICKLVFIVSSYQGSITAGENYLDYESIDCVDMLYDQNNGVIMSLEKTISGSCYIQTLDVLGLSIQKQSSRGFKNSTMEPLGITYLTQLDSFVVVYASITLDSSFIYVQHFDFDGNDIKLGLRYLDDLSTYMPDNFTKRERYVFEVPGTKLCIYGSQSDIISVFEDGYHGNPSAFLGFAMDSVRLEDDSNNPTCRIMIKGHIYTNEIEKLPLTFVGKKIYLTDGSKKYPNNLSTNGQHGIFVGTCLDVNRIIIGL